NLTTAEIFRGLNEGDYVYDAVEENLRRLMIEEKPDAVLPVRACDRDLITGSSDAVLSTRASEGDLLTDGSSSAHQPLEPLCQEKIAKKETLDQNSDNESKDDGDQDVFDFNQYGKNNDDELKVLTMLNLK
uniref:Rho-GAP domain-containing protein n=1 Tax=Haemonchus contortus TaxID=6289 RepID=A0A7I4Z1I3_HAECO